MSENPFRRSLMPAAFAAGVIRDGVQLGSLNNLELRELCEVYADEALAGTLSMEVPDGMAGLFDGLKKIGQKVIDVVKKPVIKVAEKIGGGNLQNVGMVASLIPGVGPIVGGAISAVGSVMDARKAQKDYEKQLKAQGVSDQQAAAMSSQYAADYTRQIQMQQQGLQPAGPYPPMANYQASGMYAQSPISFDSIIRDPRFFIPAGALALLAVIMLVKK